MSVCLCRYMDVNQGRTNRNCFTQRLLPHTDLLTNPDRIPKTRSVWLTLCVKIACRKSAREYTFSRQPSLTAVSSVSVISLVNGNTLWTQKHTKRFFIYSLQNLTDCDKIWYILSWLNLSYRNVNVFRLAWIVSLLYFVKLRIRILQVNSS